MAPVSFWHHIPQPIIGLSPMDGVTDPAFRFIVARHGKPDVQVTEFVNVDEVCHGVEAAWQQLQYAEIERPVVAQIYGADPDKFYQVAQVVCELGFDGVDINMGCPSKNVSARGCGAALIRNPTLAREIIRAVQSGVRDWASGHRIESIGLRPKVVERVLALAYRGRADWGAIARAAKLIRETSTLVLGNGDVESLHDLVARVQETQVHGVLIGRGALGNPWIFRAKEWARAQVANRGQSPYFPGTVPLPERFQVALEHARYFESLGGAPRFAAMRKHLGWYCTGFFKAAEVRSQMFRATSSQDVERILAAIG
jgi:tRNA-dihydrouridine synthase